MMALEVKVRRGSLRFYVRGADAHIRMLIDAAEAQSVEICERDGTPGRLRKQPDRAYKTLCDACARALGYHDTMRVSS
jgi:hypothetical protein